MLLVFVFYVVVVAVFGVHTSSSSTCGLREYTSRDGGCCPKCNEGMKVRRDCRDNVGTLCQPCEPRTFMDKPNNLKKCFSCTSCNRGDGLSVKQACTNKSDAVCDTLSGYFCINYSDVTGCSLAKKHSQCHTGQMIKEPGTARSDTVCEDCQQGYFSADGVNCTLWTKGLEVN